MYYHIRCMHVKYPLNRDNRFVKTVITKKILKLHKFATCNSNFEKSLLSDMHYLTPDICVEFETNRLVSYSGTAFQIIFFYERRTDGQTDGRTDIASDNIKQVFFENKKLLKTTDSTRFSSSNLLHICSIFAAYFTT